MGERVEVVTFCDAHMMIHDDEVRDQLVPIGTIKLPNGREANLILCEKDQLTASDLVRLIEWLTPRWRQGQGGKTPPEGMIHFSKSFLTCKICGKEMRPPSRAGHATIAHNMAAYEIAWLVPENVVHERCPDCDYPVARITASAFQMHRKTAHPENKK